MANSVLRMHRTISTDDVESYAHHVPKGEVELSKEDIMYTRCIDICQWYHRMQTYARGWLAVLNSVLSYFSLPVTDHVRRG